MHTRRRSFKEHALLHVGFFSLGVLMFSGVLAAERDGVPCIGCAFLPAALAALLVGGPHAPSKSALWIVGVGSAYVYVCIGYYLLGCFRSSKEEDSDSSLD